MAGYITVARVPPKPLDKEEKEDKKENE